MTTRTCSTNTTKTTSGRLYLRDNKANYLRVYWYTCCHMHTYVGLYKCRWK